VGDPSAPRASLEALLSLLVACDLPAVLWLASHFVRSLDEHMIADPALATLLVIEARFLLARRVVGALLAPRSRAVRSGLVQAGVAAQILRSVFIFTWGGQLFAAPHEMLTTPPYELASFGGLCELMWLGSILLSILLLLGQNAAIGRLVFARVEWLRGAWRVILPMLVLAAVAVMVLYGMGYAAGARHVIKSTGRASVAIVSLVGLFVLLSNLGDRIVRKVNERLAIEGELTAALDARTRAMSVAVRAGTVVVIGILAIFLQRVWGIGEFTVDFLRSVQIAQLDDLTRVTGASVLFAILWIVAGHFISRNLGRVFEHFVEPVAGTGSRGEQLAWLTLTRYGILTATWAAAFLALHVDLTTLGWLLTAVSVGLGFGLQEIVANFVSGLILLFEKPIRVGDVITVGTTGGTVDRITIRATVVTNWERQTIIVPNKKFISEELTNWTRQDMTVRRKLTLGVARGTDVDQVLAILEEVVGEHPGVMGDPPHRVWFEGYGEYTLDFEVWFFASFGDGLRLKTELYTKLVKRLKEEGIEVPIPTEVRVHGAEEPTTRPSSA
jgi:small-conductance mechanosensitive channel